MLTSACNPFLIFSIRLRCPSILAYVVCSLPVRGGSCLLLLQELLKDSIHVLRQKCESMIAEVEAFESGVDFDEAMP